MLVSGVFAGRSSVCCICVIPYSLSVLHLCGSLLCLILVLLVGWQDLSVRCEAGWLFGPRRSNLLVCPVTGRGAVITGVCAGFTPELSSAVACISCCIQPGSLTCPLPGAPCPGGIASFEAHAGCWS